MEEGEKKEFSEYDRKLMEAMTQRDPDRVIYQRDRVTIKGFSDGYLWIAAVGDKHRIQLKLRLTWEDASEILDWLGIYHNEFQLNDGTWLNDYTHPEVKK